MKKLPLLLIMMTFIYSLTHLSIINQMTEATFNTIHELFFSLFFLMFLFSIANDMGLFIIIGQPLKKLFSPLFHLNEISSSIYFASIFAGYPTFSKIIKDAYTNKQINKQEANHLLKISSHGSIGFMVFTLGTVLFNDLRIGWIIFMIQIISNMMIAFITRNEIITNSHQIKKYTNQISFISILKIEMVACVKVFIYIFGFMLVFNILSHMFLQDFFYLHGFLEFSQGCLNLKNESFQMKLILSNLYISFSSLSVIFQVSSVLDGLDLDIQGYIKARILQAFICLLLSLGFLLFR